MSDEASVKAWGTEQEVLDRMTQTWEASRPIGIGGNSHIEQRLAAVVEHSRLFVRWIIPLWPPKFLVRKLARRMVLPFFSPQIEFNEAVRDVTLELYRRNNQLNSDLKTALAVMQDMEEQISLLRGQLYVLEGQAKARGTEITAVPVAHSAHSVVNGAHAGR